MEKLEWKSLVSLSQGLDIYSSEFFIGIESKGFAGWMKKARRNWLERFLARSYFCRRYSFLSGHPWIHRESISKRYYREAVEIFIGPLALRQRQPLTSSPFFHRFLDGEYGEDGFWKMDIVSRVFENYSKGMNIIAIILIYSF